MTAIVGILCQDGVIIGTDSSATFSSGRMPTVEQPIEKLLIVQNSIIIAGTGQVGLGQRFEAIVNKLWDSRVFSSRITPMEITKRLTTETIKDFSQTFAPKEQYSALVAFPTNGTFHLCEFALSDFQPELKTPRLWYASLGSTQLITDSFLALMRDIFWTGGPPPLSDGIFAATWALNHAIDVNPGGVNKPIRIAVLEPKGDGVLKAELLKDTQLAEHQQNIDGAKNALRKYCQTLNQHNEGETPNIPKPL